MCVLNSYAFVLYWLFCSIYWKSVVGLLVYQLSFICHVWSIENCRQLILQCVDSPVHAASYIRAQVVSFSHGAWIVH